MIIGSDRSAGAGGSPESDPRGGDNRTAIPSGFADPSSWAPSSAPPYAEARRTPVVESRSRFHELHQRFARRRLPLERTRQKHTASRAELRDSPCEEPKTVTSFPRK